MSLAPVEALLFSNQKGADNFMNQSYQLPTFQEIFNSWPRFSDTTYDTTPNQGSTWTGAPSDWVYNTETDQVEFAANLGRAYRGFPVELRDPGLPDGAPRRTAAGPRPQPRASASRSPSTSPPAK